jgi:hypothetical protein
VTAAYGVVLTSPPKQDDQTAHPRPPRTPKKLNSRPKESRVVFLTGPRRQLFEQLGVVAQASGQPVQEPRREPRRRARFDPVNEQRTRRVPTRRSNRVDDADSYTLVDQINDI